MKLLSAVSSKRMIMTDKKKAISLAMKQRKRDVSKKLEQRKASSKDKAKDMRTYFKIIEKPGNGENQQVQENVPIDIIEID